MRCVLPSVVPLLVGCCFAVPARGYELLLGNRAVESLDWKVADSDLVVRGRVVMVLDRVDPISRAYDWEEARIRVYETIKGRAVEGDMTVLRSTRQVPRARWPEGTCLFFLVHGSRATWLKNPDFLEGRYLLVDPASRIVSLESSGPRFAARAPRIGDDDDEDDEARRRLCVACGYDVRHGPVRCPECGARREWVVSVGRGVEGT